MNKLKYMFAAAIVGLSLTACDDDDNSYDILDGIGMVNRSVSLADGATVRAATIDRITLDYNNIVGINPDIAITLNGQPVKAEVNPEDRKSVV